jgi:hypothetical protein
MRKILESVRRRERMMSKTVLHYFSDRFAMTTTMRTKWVLKWWWWSNATHF